ncbi:hypothetical protein [Salinibacterium sp. SWN248]|uniref:hypothetical protein n=1 Tax=Salinibacterium sp. SWN248 TaxID=2792056 RepID=UPI0018CE55BA|nr:hypothetical protein [Salinibacterium sp. SWN248]MBH0023979.1 hypothetical protein [Salinibacterium sp. SWN248]
MSATCPNGHQSSDGSLFCNVCGSSIAAAETEESSDTKEPAEMGENFGSMLDNKPIDRLASPDVKRLPLWAKIVVPVGVGVIALGFAVGGEPLRYDPLQVEYLDATSDSVTHSGVAPEITNVSPEGIAGFDIDWVSNSDAQGWQIQYSVDHGETWIDETSEGMIGEDAARYAGSDITWYDRSDPGGTELVIRLRMAFGSETVTPWAEAGPFRTAGSISPACLDGFRTAIDEAEAGSGDSELRRTLDICEDRDEWILAAQMLPRAMGVTSSTASEAASTFAIICEIYPGQVCT